MMDKITVVIKQSTDGKFLGKEVETDLQTLTLPSGEEMNIERRIYIGDGKWKLWNSNYIIEVEEVGQVTGYEVINNEIVLSTIKKEVE
jgi:PAS domain-containing protein